jgi:hypothetical protein
VTEIGGHARLGLEGAAAASGGVDENQDLFPRIHFFWAIGKAGHPEPRVAGVSNPAARVAVAQ